MPTTKLQQLKQIWDGLLPHRALQVSEASIKVTPQSANNPTSYDGSEMSDGERAIFYFLGQCLVARKTALIIDEPEGHIHKAILGPLWDTVEKARPDCGFVYITHDLDFAVTRAASSSTSFVLITINRNNGKLRACPKIPGCPNMWSRNSSAAANQFCSSRASGSMDLTIYRHQYAEFTIVPIGSCDAVIHSVASYRGSSTLHRLGACGLVDADHRDAAEVDSLLQRKVYVLPVAEIENLLLLPEVFLALADALHCPDPSATLARLKLEVMEEARANLTWLVRVIRFGSLIVA